MPYQIEGMGICECGCGERIPLFGWRGAPLRFKRGHNSKGKNNPMWNGGLVWQGQYWRTWEPTHPRADKHGYIYLHLKIYEATNNCCVLKCADVDHINGDKTDNRPENLQTLMRGDHTRKHKPRLGLALTQEHKDKISMALKGRKRGW